MTDDIIGFGVTLAMLVGMFLVTVWPIAKILRSWASPEAEAAIQRAIDLDRVQPNKRQGLIAVKVGYVR